MKPNEPSLAALMIARQRAAHQVLDHGSILYDPFAMKILREDEKDVLYLCQSISSGTIWERSSSPQAFSKIRPRFSLDSGWCPI
jgi:O-methyltransferase involved in polyketide biosynthesis